MYAKCVEWVVVVVVVRVVHNGVLGWVASWQLVRQCWRNLRRLREWHTTLYTVVLLLLWLFHQYQVQYSTAQCSIFYTTAEYLCLGLPLCTAVVLG